jgi:hypothetical protein
VAKVVARLLAIRQPSGFESRRISLKYKMGDISKGVANSLYPANKNFQRFSNFHNSVRYGTEVIFIGFLDL